MREDVERESENRRTAARKNAGDTKAKINHNETDIDRLERRIAMPQNTSKLWGLLRHSAVLTTWITARSQLETVAKLDAFCLTTQVAAAAL